MESVIEGTLDAVDLCWQLQNEDDSERGVVGFSYNAYPENSKARALRWM